MDDLNNRGFDSDSGTPYENAGKNKLEKGYDSEKGTPYESVGDHPYGADNNFSNSETDNSGNTEQQRNAYGYPINGGFQQYNSKTQNAENAKGYYETPKGYYAAEVYPQKNSGLAIAAFIISILNFIVFRNFLSFITVPLCIILAIISLVGKRSGKGLAIASIVISVISACIFISVTAVVVKLYPDMKYFVENEQQIVEQYEEDGTIPERYKKYDTPRFQKYWKAMGCDDFEEFFGLFIQMYSKEKSKITDDDSVTQSKSDYPITA